VPVSDKNRKLNEINGLLVCLGSPVQIRRAQRATAGIFFSGSDKRERKKVKPDQQLAQVRAQYICYSMDVFIIDDAGVPDRGLQAAP